MVLYRLLCSWHLDPALRPRLLLLHKSISTEGMLALAPSNKLQISVEKTGKKYWGKKEVLELAANQTAFSLSICLKNLLLVGLHFFCEFRHTSVCVCAGVAGSILAQLVTVQLYFMPVLDETSWMEVLEFIQSSWR